jgi:hypothetical protein
MRLRSSSRACMDRLISDPHGRSALLFVDLAALPAETDP